MLAIPPPTTARTTDPLIAIVRADAGALEFAAHRGHLVGLTRVPDAELDAQISWAYRTAYALPGGLAGAVAADFCDGPAAFCRRMLDALWRSARLHHAEQRWADLTTGLVPRHVAEHMLIALAAQHTGEKNDD